MEISVVTLSLHIILKRYSCEERDISCRDQIRFVTRVVGASLKWPFQELQFFRKFCIGFIFSFGAEKSQQLYLSYFITRVKYRFNTETLAGCSLHALNVTETTEQIYTKHKGRTSMSEIKVSLTSCEGNNKRTNVQIPTESLNLYNDTQITDKK